MKELYFINYPGLGFFKGEFVVYLTASKYFH